MAICRESAIQCSKHVEILGNLLLGLLSDAFGLQTDDLKDMECSIERASSVLPLLSSMPGAELSIGPGKHSDAGFLTILPQNHISTSLQVMYEGQWVDIEPFRGALVVNIGDLLQVRAYKVRLQFIQREIHSMVSPIHRNSLIT